MAQEAEQPQIEGHLTLKQQLFVNAYMGEARGNATEAARIAGYSASKRQTLASVGSENLRKPEIAAAIRARVSEIAMSAEEVLHEMAEIARGSMADFVDTEHFGKPTITMAQRDIDTGEKTPATKAHLIKKLTVTDGDVSSVQIELYSKFDALVQLGKFHKLWTERTEITGKDGEPLYKAYPGVDTDEV